MDHFFWTRSTREKWFLRKFCQYSSTRWCHRKIECQKSFFMEFLKMSLDARSWESATLTNLFPRNQKWTFWTYIFFLCPLSRERRCAAIKITSTIYTFAQYKNTKSWSSVGSLSKWCCPHIHDQTISHFLAFLGAFWHIWWNDQ